MPSHSGQKCYGADSIASASPSLIILWMAVEVLWFRAKLRELSRGRCYKSDESSTTYTCVIPVRSLANATSFSSGENEGCG